ncbi:hypothetical protein Gorai_016635 [Gossypium raimondii]|uniref:DUF4283 domain-containing protein n=1 Tax=Gossypium raimondii TaxID=29730 RepID=A0A7J8P9M1_GOSRA|nr:hypothetical protein [Gossypium raimondii]
MRNTMVKLWHPLGGVLVSDLGEKRYFFKFYHELDIDRVINGAPWTFNNHLLVFHWMEEVEDPLQAYSLKALLNNLETLLANLLNMMQRKSVEVIEAICEFELTVSGKELELGCDLSLRTLAKRATIVTSVWLWEDDNAIFWVIILEGKIKGVILGGQNVESSSGGKLNMMDQDFKESPFEDIEGKKRPQVSIKSLNFSTGPDSMVHNDERVSPSDQHISAVAVRRADQKQ